MKKCHVLFVQNKNIYLWIDQDNYIPLKGKYTQEEAESMARILNFIFMIDEGGILL
jgi:hypothetical protein